MPTRTAQCPQRETAVALAQGRLVGPERDHVERHLEHCESCRTAFRQHTAARFPRFRNYTILDELGKGGFGVVYKAVQHGKERIEALKVLSGKTALREAYFENEVHLIAKLRHPNIATLYEAHLRTAPRYYTMEYVEGQNLDDYIRAHDLSLEERIEIIKTVARAVAYAHQQGVIHRDLKPQNILIDQDGQPRILDFGIAKRLRATDEEEEGAGEDSATQASEGVLGTYGYMPPEQIAGQAVDERSDVYSLGALLFHAITGQPARFAQQRERLTAVLRERCVSRADDLAAIIACCVAAVPESRYPTGNALVDDLDNYLAGRSVRAQPDATPAYRVARVSALVVRNHPAAVQVAAVLAVILTLSLLFWAAGARWLTTAADPGGAALIAFDTGTIEAIRTGELGADIPGLSADQRKSWRLLYGRLMERLAEANVRAVVWDYFFPDQCTEYDAAFVRGVEALKVPVIVGSAKFDVDGEPTLSPLIRSAVHGWGTLYIKDAAFLHDEINVLLALQRGFNPPVPSISVAGCAAARFPDSMLDVRGQADHLELRYRKRQVEPGRSRWRPETDRITVFEVEDVGSQHTLSGLLGGFKSGDKLFLGRYRLEDVVAWRQRAIAAAQVFAADSEQLRRWFAGRVVLIGEMSTQDQHRLQSGEMIHGCQIHVHVLATLLADAQIYRLGRPGLALRVGAWCILAVLLVNLLPIRGHWSRPRAGVLAVAIFGVGMIAGVATALTVTTPWAVEAALGGCALASAGGLALMIRLLHQRQLRLTPGPIWPADGTTVSTTMMVTTSDAPPSDA